MTTLTRVALALGLAGSVVTPAGAAEPPTDGPSIAIVPPDMSSKANPEAPPRLTNAMSDGVDNGGASFAVLDASDCRAAKAPCFDAARDAGATHLLQLSVEQGDREYKLELSLWDVESRKQVRSSEASCEICGLEEAATLTADEATALTRRLFADGPALGQVALSSNPKGAEIVVDGQPKGKTPATLELPPGEYEITVRQKGYAQKTVIVTVEAGIREALPIELTRTGSKKRRIIGWSLVGVSVPLVGAGAALLAIDGRAHDPTCDPVQMDVNGKCPFTYETTGVGSALVAAGAAALISGVTLVILGRKSKTSGTQALRPRPHGLGLRF